MVSQAEFDKAKAIYDHLVADAKIEGFNLLLVLNEMNLKQLQEAGYDSHHIARERVVRQTRDRITQLRVNFHQRNPLGMGVVV